MSKNLQKNNKKNNYQIIILAVAVLSVLTLYYFSKTSTSKDIDETFLEELVRDEAITKIDLNAEANRVKITIKPSKYDQYNVKEENFLSPQPQFHLTILSERAFIDYWNGLKKEYAHVAKIKVVNSKGDSKFISILTTWGFIGISIFVFWILMRRMSGGGGAGGQIFNIGKSKAALFDAENKVKITFADVAGLDEAKEEVKEVVEFLKTPKKFTSLGGKIPKGALLVGPPGTGKTLLAKAVAGEAEVPFFSLSGSDFVEMFVGVGAARVRDLFKKAKDKAPCIIFIDEVDAIGRTRGKGQMPGSNDERENTLNSLLVEMDGFGTDLGVIILAATNRPDVLDSALLRPGRFDRQISIDKPDILGRVDIFDVHLKPIKVSKSVDSKKLAAQTAGFAGAEIANVCNEAALIAARRNQKEVEMDDFQDAIDRVIGGLEKKNKIISPEEKKIVAFHEAGHAVSGWFLEHTDPLVKVSIVPRGIAALGYAQYLPKEQFLYQKEQLTDDICMALGGRAAEEIVFGKVSTGALSDLERITKLAYSIVSIYGMNEKIGNISFYEGQKNEYNFSKPYSEATAKKIDEEAKKIVEDCYKRTLKLLHNKREALDAVANELLQKEIIFQEDLERLIGKRPFESQTFFDTLKKDKKKSENIKSENITQPSEDNPAHKLEDFDEDNLENEMTDDGQDIKNENITQPSEDDSTHKLEDFNEDNLENEVVNDGQNTKKKDSKTGNPAKSKI